MCVYIIKKLVYAYIYIYRGGAMLVTGGAMAPPKVLKNFLE